MISALIGIGSILLTLLFVVGTHEFAHFAMARLVGVKVLRFSIGFGKRLLHWHDKSGTEYVFALVPLGGYVKMLDENEDGAIDPKEAPFAYNRQPFYKKFLIVLAGPACNLVCAILLYWMIYMVGFTAVKPLVGDVTPNSIAAQAGLQAQQLIVAVDNKPVSSWMGIIFRLMSHVGEKSPLTIVVEDKNHAKKTVQLNVSTWHLDELTPDPLTSLGFKPYMPPIPMIVGMIDPKAPAAKANLRYGDTLLAINKKPVNNWEDLVTLIAEHPGATLTFTLRRGSQTLDVPVMIEKNTHWFGKPTGYLGIGPRFSWPSDLLQNVQLSPLAALQRATQQTYDFAYFNLLFLGKMLTGKLSLQSLGGPISIFQGANNALNSGWLAFVSFLAFLSVSVGVVNLLPIPGLDGGHLAIQAIERILKRPLPDPLLNILYRVGFALIFVVLIQALVNDFLRLR